MHFAKTLTAGLATFTVTLAGAAAAAAPEPTLSAAAAPAGPPTLGMVACEKSGAAAQVYVDGCFAVPESNPPRFFSIGCGKDASSTTAPVYRDCESDSTCGKCKPGHAVSSKTCFNAVGFGSELPPFAATCAADAIRMSDTKGFFDSLLDTIGNGWGWLTDHIFHAGDMCTADLGGDIVVAKKSDCSPFMLKGATYKVVDGTTMKATGKTTTCDGEEMVEVKARFWVDFAYKTASNYVPAKYLVC